MRLVSLLISEFSANKKSKCRMFLLVFFVFNFAQMTAQNTGEFILDEVVVTAGRTAVSTDDLTRNVEVITFEDIKRMPVSNLQDLLNYIIGVDLKQRSSGGMQSDVSLRGGTFEQTLILVDGVKIIDPQTGHHNSNLPLSIDDVQRIEILKGHGSRVFGPNAFSGAINIITEKGYKKKLVTKLNTGTHQFLSNSLVFSYPLSFWNNKISLLTSRSGGYRYNTDYDLLNLAIVNGFHFEKLVINTFAGYLDKDFGANSFYSASFPDQREHTKTSILNARIDFSTGNFDFSSKIFWRRNKDDFLLKYQDPQFYHNAHKSDSYGAEIQSTFTTDLGKTSLGTEFNIDKIKSNNLGNHSRDKVGFFTEHVTSPMNDLKIVIGIFANKYNTLEWELWPGLDLSYSLSQNMKIYGSYGKAFRIPTYTELFYNDPVTSGNPELMPERLTEISFGLLYKTGGISVTIGAFDKRGNNIIDWVKKESGIKWQVKNITKLRTDGFEFGFVLIPREFLEGSKVTHVGISYTYINLSKKIKDYISRYALENLRHQLIFSISHMFIFNFTLDWFLRFENRINSEKNLVVDYQIKNKIDRINFFLKINNLFNYSYEDFAGIPAPGRWIFAGFELDLL